MKLKPESKRMIWNLLFCIPIIFFVMFKSIQAIESGVNISVVLGLSILVVYFGTKTVNFLYYAVIDDDFKVF